jgi:hypothetical protein
MSPEKLIAEIIREQSQIIGEQLARTRAEGTGAVKFNSSKLEDLTLTQENPAKAIELLINSYENIFGQASVEVCLDVIKKYPSEEVSTYIPEKFKR